MAENTVSRRSVVLACGLVCIACADLQVAGAADLSRLVPDNTLLHIEIAGTEATRDARSATAWGKITSDPAVRNFRKNLLEVVDVLLKRATAEEGAEEVYEAVERVVFALADRPVALSVHDLGVHPQMGPFARATLVVHTGSNATSFLADVEQCLAALGLPPGGEVTLEGDSWRALPVPLPGGAFYGVEGDYFLLAVSPEAAQSVRQACRKLPAESLAKSVPLQRARQRIGGDGNSRIMTVHLNLRGLLEAVRLFIPAITREDMKQAETINRMISALDADRLVSWTMEMHHRGSGCLTAYYLQTDVPPARLPFLGPPTTVINDKEIAVVPRESSWAVVSRTHLSKVWAKLMKIMAVADPELEADINEQVRRFNTKAGVDVRADLIDQLGEPLIMYDHPAHLAGATFGQGVVISFGVEGGHRVLAALEKLATAANQWIDEPKVSVSARRTEYRDHVLLFLNISGVPLPVAPACTVHESRLYCALYPQILFSVVDHLLDADPERDSLLGNPEFKRARRVVGQGYAVVWSDPRQTLDGLYALLLPVAQVGASIAQGEGVDVDISAIPPRQAIIGHIFGQVAVSTADDNGIMWKSYGPLPVPVPSLGSSSVASVGLMTSILLPSLSRARELSKRLVCSSNLKAIGISLMVIANDNPNGEVPGLDALVDSGALTPKQLICPSSKGPGPHYVLVPLDRTQFGRGDVVWAYEPKHHHNEGGNILFADGHVEFVRGGRYDQLIARLGG